MSHFATVRHTIAIRMHDPALDGMPEDERARAEGVVSEVLQEDPVTEALDGVLVALTAVVVRRAQVSVRVEDNLRNLAHGFTVALRTALPADPVARLLRFPTPAVSGIALTREGAPLYRVTADLWRYPDGEPATSYRCALEFVVV